MDLQHGKRQHICGRRRGVEGTSQPKAPGVTCISRSRSEERKVVREPGRFLWTSLTHAGLGRCRCGRPMRGPGSVQTGAPGNVCCLGTTTHSLSIAGVPSRTPKRPNRARRGFAVVGDRDRTSALPEPEMGRGDCDRADLRVCWVSRTSPPPIERGSWPPLTSLISVGAMRRLGRRELLALLGDAARWHMRAGDISPSPQPLVLSPPLLFVAFVPPCH